ncbi:MAG: MliC family protein [Bacteroidota bacterium]
MSRAPFRARLATAVLAATTAIVVGCARSDPTAPRRVTFVCPGGTLLLAAFFPDDDRMRLTVDGTDYDLPRLISASGARYGSAGVTFWNKGREALFQRHERLSYSGCVAQPE